MSQVQRAHLLQTFSLKFYEKTLIKLRTDEVGQVQRSHLMRRAQLHALVDVLRAAHTLAFIAAEQLYQRAGCKCLAAQAHAKLEKA